MSTLPITSTLPSVSADGYLRLTFQQLPGIPLVHLISGLDEYADPLGPQAAVVTDITGYTEWVGGGDPAISIGWDWQLPAGNSHPVLIRLSPPRSNLMLIDNISRADLGQDKTTRLLEEYVDGLAWQQTVLSHLNLRYRV